MQLMESQSNNLRILVLNLLKMKKKTSINLSESSLKKNSIQSDYYF